MISTSKQGLAVPLTILTIVLAFAGCSESALEKQATAPPVLRADPSTEPEVILPSQLRRKLKANEKAKFQKEGSDIVGAELFQSGVKSIEALRGLPLRSLDLGMTEVNDLSPIEGMPLKSLILENTPIVDLSAIKGMQLEVLYLQNSAVTDLSVIYGMPLRQLNLMAVSIDDLTKVAELPLETLWVPQTQVTDISPLKGKPMISLDISGTKVESIEALAGMKTLKRLSILDTPVSDLTPLLGISLERITLSPQSIETGIELLRAMPSLAFIPTSPQNPNQSADEFWRMYDAGFWNPADEAASGTEPSGEKKMAAGKKFDKLLNESESVTEAKDELPSNDEPQGEKSKSAAPENTESTDVQEDKQKASEKSAEIK